MWAATVFFFSLGELRGCRAKQAGRCHALPLHTQKQKKQLGSCDCATNQVLFLPCLGAFCNCQLWIFLTRDLKHVVTFRCRGSQLRCPARYRAVKCARLSFQCSFSPKRASRRHSYFRSFDTRGPRSSHFFPYVHAGTLAQPQ